LLPSQIEDGLAELIGCGLATCDSFAAMRQLAIPPSKRAFPLYAVGRWSLLPLPPAGTRASEAAIELAAKSLLARLGVLSHGILLDDRCRCRGACCCVRCVDSSSRRSARRPLRQRLPRRTVSRCQRRWRRCGRVRQRSPTSP
jgi:hypothetical protein